MEKIELLAVSVKDVVQAMEDVESRFFRTEHDTGAIPEVKMVWDAFRRNLRLDRVRLPTFCEGCKVYHLDHCAPLGGQQAALQERATDGENAAESKGVAGGPRAAAGGSGSEAAAYAAKDAGRADPVGVQ